MIYDFGLGRAISLERVSETERDLHWPGCMLGVGSGLVVQIEEQLTSLPWQLVVRQMHHAQAQRVADGRNQLFCKCSDLHAREV